MLFCPATGVLVIFTSGVVLTVADALQVDGVQILAVSVGSVGVVMVAVLVMVGVVICAGVPTVVVMVNFNVPPAAIVNGRLLIAPVPFAGTGHVAAGMLLTALQLQL